MRDWRKWHDDYRDPSSELSQRLGVVQQAIRGWLDAAAPGPLRLISMCAGQGHDVVGALRGHARRADMSGLFVELDPANVAVAREGLRRDPDLTPAIRRWFGEAGFEELSFTSPGPDRFAVGVHRLAMRPAAYSPAPRLFAFER